MAFTRFLKAAATGEPVSVYGDGEQIRDFTYVGDIVAAVLAAIDAEVPLLCVMNLSGGSSASVNEVLDVSATSRAARSMSGTRPPCGVMFSAPGP